MLKNIIIILSLLIGQQIFSQELQTKWFYSINRADDGSFILNLKAEIPDIYYMYGMNIKEGPLPLEFSFENAENFLIEYNFSEITVPKKVFDDVFGVEVSTYHGLAEFQCKFIPKENISSLNLIIDGQVCNKKDGSCFPLRKEIKVNF